MHNKGLLVLAIFTFLFSPAAYCQYTYEGTSDNYNNGQSYRDVNGYPSQPFNDATYSDPGAFEDNQYYSRPGNDNDDSYYRHHESYAENEDSYEDETVESSYNGKLPSQIAPPGEKLIVIDPRAHAWGAYTPEGQLVKSGLASAGAKWCKDRGRPCRTTVGSFRIFSLGESDCVSSIYPLDEGGGAPMPYCMFFNGNQGLHGSNHLADANISHGCVRVSVRDAAWIRFDFARIGTKIIVKPY